MPDCANITVLNLILFAAAFIFCAGFTYFLIKLSHRLRIYDYPGERKRHTEPTPMLGGVGIFFCFWILMFAGSSLCPQYLFADLPFLPAFFISSTFIFLIGVIDDLVELRFYHKLLGQTCAALIMIAFGFHMFKISVPFWRSFELGWTAYPLTVLWIVVVSNSINLIDGMDGLAAVISITVCIGLIIIAAFLDLHIVSMIAAILAGSLAGFLIFNRPKAKIFLGDSGSLFLGYIFAVMAIVLPIKSYTAVTLFVPLVAVGLPLLEIVTTVIRRSASGRKIYLPDNRHIFHYLIMFNFSPKQILLILGSISLLFNAFIPALFWFDRKQVFSIFVMFLMILVGIFFILKQSKGANKI